MNADPDQTAPDGPEQSDLGLHCLALHLHLMDAFICKTFTVIILCVPSFKILTISEKYEVNREVRCLSQRRTYRKK